MPIHILFKFPSVREICAYRIIHNDPPEVSTLHMIPLYCHSFCDMFASFYISSLNVMKYLEFIYANTRFRDNVLSVWLFQNVF